MSTFGMVCFIYSHAAKERILSCVKFCTTISIAGLEMERKTPGRFVWELCFQKRKDSTGSGPPPHTKIATNGAMVRWCDGAGDQVAASVNNLGVALFDRGLHMRSHVDSRRRHVIAIYREHIQPTTMWWDKNAMMEYESADTN